MRIFDKVQEPRLLLTALVAVGVMFGAASSSRAQLMLSGPPTITPVAGGLYKWDYVAILPAGYSLNYGDYFTIYDFDGFVAMSQSPSGHGWNPTTNVTGVKEGPTPSGLDASGIDAWNITNLNWMWIWPGISATGSDLNLGDFSALSTYGGAKAGTYAEKSHTNSGANAYAFGPTYVPDPDGSSINDLGGGPPDLAPEPSSLALMLGGASVFPVLSLLRRGRTRRTSRG